MAHWIGEVGAGLLMLLWYLFGLGVLFFIIYEAVYLGIRRALKEAGDELSAGTSSAGTQPRPSDQD